MQLLNNLKVALNIVGQISYLLMVLHLEEGWNGTGAQRTVGSGENWSLVRSSAV